VLYDQAFNAGIIAVVVRISASSILFATFLTEGFFDGLIDDLSGHRVGIPACLPFGDDLVQRSHFVV
jgi:hypothetical protein